MFHDEREDTLREVAALGNIKATIHFAHSGVNVNSQNKMNGWTALHWASHRGHEHVITALLRNGADPNIKTNKGQTAYDLAVKHQNCAEILRVAMGQSANVTVGPEPELPIVPTYLQNPDLEKTWLMPDEFSDKKLENVIRRQTAVDAVNNPQPIAGTTNKDIKGSNNSEEKELLVYKSIRDDEHLLGSVYLKNESIESAMNIIKTVSVSFWVL
ncbi:ankyrin repeat-containing domain protein [Pilobolus umbonatus]|nr:ankyrin repeat-containing domain protein [Pilobolus umbonatus]